jgi:hypothetical protein
MGLREGESGVDKRQYARETAQAVSGLLAYYDATGVVAARDLAIGDALWALANRALPGGGFRHAEQDKGGPYLADNVEMAKALLALHRSTGMREWLTQAQATADFIAKNPHRSRHRRLCRFRLAGRAATDKTDQAARG